MNIDDATSNTPSCLCPQCGLKLDASTDVAGAAKPEPGDVSLCLACGCFLVYEQDLRSRRMSKDEFDALPPAVQRLLKRAAVVRDVTVGDLALPTGAKH